MSDLPEDLVPVIDLMIELYKEGDDWFKNLPATDWRRRDVEQIFTACKRKRFTNAADVKTTLSLHARKETKRPGKALVLRPWAKADEALFLLEPLFGLNAAETAPKTTFYLGVVTHAMGARRFLGYRYEGPEGGDSHNLYHAQPIRGFDGTPMEYSIGWYPDKWPTFPLHARTDCELLYSLMFSVQGMDRVRRRASGPRSRLQECAQTLLGQLEPKTSA